MNYMCCNHNYLYFCADTFYSLAHDVSNGGRGIKIEEAAADSIFSPQFIHIRRITILKPIYANRNSNSNNNFTIIIFSPFYLPDLCVCFFCVCCCFIFAHPPFIEMFIFAVAEETFLFDLKKITLNKNIPTIRIVV